MPFTFTLGDETITARTPSRLDRSLVHGPWVRTSGWALEEVIDDDGETRRKMKHDPRRIEEGNLFACALGVVGLCWPRERGGLPRFRDHGRDLIEYGEACGEVLLERYDQAELWAAGQQLYQHVINDEPEQPTAAEVGTVADF